MGVRKETVNSAFFFIVLAVLAVLGFLVVLPVLDFLLVGLLLALGFWPVHAWVSRFVPHRRLGALATLLIVALVAVVPLVVVVVSLMGDVRSLVAHMDPGDLEAMAAARLGDGMIAGLVVGAVVPHLAAFVEALVTDLARIVARMAIGLAVMAFAMYFAFADGPRLVAALKELLPLKEVYRSRLLDETRSIVEAIFFGQLLVGAAHGLVLGVAFFLFGVPNPFVWAVVVVIVSLLPAIGTPAVYLPVSIYLYFTTGPVAAVAFVVYGLVLSTAFIEYWLRLRLMDRMAQVHPLIVILGVVGGIAAFGVSGFLFGPLILSLLLVFSRVFSNEYKQDENYVFL
jgi:predicted PurR-regulated permease PerM